MSLNGLDAPQVKEAHDAVAAEPGGWFLLKYASRDEIELLSRGNGGVVEVRKTIAEYEDTSPLYGFLKYRRRNVIIKYLPEGCSRLIQARVTVHFNAVCDRFSPYDTTFEISQAEELKDTKLSAACSLHAATASNSSSSSSLRRRRLMEIAEEDEEEPRSAKRKSTVLEDNDAATEPAEPVTLNSDLATSPDQSKFSAETTSEIPNFVGVDEPPASPIEAARRTSTQSARPDFYSYSSYPYSKPKVKLAPRPSLDVISRPQTAGNFRPVSAIPAGFKLFGKSGQKKPKNKEDDDSAVASAEVEFAAPSLTTLEELPKLNTDVQRPSTSSGVSTKSAIMPAQPTKPTITPEKARLKKAMQLREKKKKMSAEAAAAAADQTTGIEGSAKETETHRVHDMEAVHEQSTEDDQHKPADSTEDTDGIPPSNVKRMTMIHADSGVMLDSLPPDHADQISEQTLSDSRPQSPAITSEPDHSTKASSLSGSTDETVQASNEDLPERKATVNPAAAEPQATTVPDTISDNTTLANALVPSQAPGSTPKTEPQELIQTVQQEATEKKDMNQIEKENQSPSEERSADEKKSTDEDPSRPPAASEDQIQHDDSAVLSNGASLEEPQLVAKSLETPAAAVSTKAPEEVASEETSQARPTEGTEIEANQGPNLPQSSIPLISTPDEPLDSPAVGFDAADDKSNEADDEDLPNIPTLESPSLKNRPAMMAIRTDLAQAHGRNVSQPQSEAHLSDDEELMEELQSATVQEATSMTVAKTPLTPVFPVSAKGPPASSPVGSPHIVRTVSNPIRGNLISPGDVSQSSARSVSSSGAAFLHKVTQQQQPSGNLSKKTVGSSISQRIKALEMLSAHSGESPAGTTNRERPSSTFFAVRKEREPSRSPSVADRATPFTRNTPPPASSSVSRDPSPGEVRERQRERSRSVASRLSMFESTPPHNSKATSQSPSQRPRGRPESISVAAKIVRDPDQSMLKILEPPKDLSEYPHLDLKQSPLVVDHQRAVLKEEAPVAEESVPDRRTSKESRRSESQDLGKDDQPRRSSFTRVREFIKDRRKSITSTSGEVFSAPPAANASRSPTRPPSAHQNNSSFAQRLSISSRRSLSKDRDNSLSPGAYTEGSLSSDEAKSNGSEKMKSRAGRFMRRLSTLSGSGARNKVSSPPVLSPTLPEEDPIPEPVVPRPSTTNTPAIISDMGDVNVQFPDNLLWKRRNMCIDAQGFLILSALPAQLGRPAQGTKRYHLSEFRSPYIPDVEIQELPNSVVLDLIEGSGVQLACEDRAGQMRVLDVLREAHGSHATAFGR